MKTLLPAYGLSNLSSRALIEEKYKHSHLFLPCQAFEVCKVWLSTSPVWPLSLIHVLHPSWNWFPFLTHIASPSWLGALYWPSCLPTPHPAYTSFLHSGGTMSSLWHPFNPVCLSPTILLPTHNYHLSIFLWFHIGIYAHLDGIICFVVIVLLIYSWFIKIILK